MSTLKIFGVFACSTFHHFGSHSNYDNITIC